MKNFSNSEKSSRFLKKFSKEAIKQHFELPLFKNAYYMIIGTGITSVFGFIFWIIATRLYSTEIIGLVSALVSILSLFAVLSELGLGIGLIRFLPEAGSDGNSLINTCFTISSLFSISLSIIFIFGLPFWGPIYIQLFQEPLMFLSFIVFAVIFSLFPLLSTTFLAKRVTKMIVYMNLISSIWKIGLLIVIAKISPNFYGLFAAIGISTLIGLVCGLYIFLPRIQRYYRPVPVLNIDLFQNIRNYSIVNYFGRLLLQMTPLIFPIMIVNVLGPEMNAFFTISYTFVAIIQVIPSSIFNSLLAESTNENILNKINLRRSVFLTLILLIPITLFIIAFPGQILSLFGREYSDQGAGLLRTLILSVIPWGIIYLFVSVERLKKISYGVIYVTGLAAGLSLGFGYILMVQWGLMGLGIGYLLGQTVVAIIVTILLLKVQS
jgi:O-antigen/teichoic acid export membrane protein